MSRRRKAERPSQASADEAVRRTSVEQGSDTPGTLQGGKEARQARLESRIRAGPHRKRRGASQRSQLGLHRPGQLIDGVVNPALRRDRQPEREHPMSRRMRPPAGPPERGRGGLPADRDRSRDARQGWTGSGVPGGRKAHGGSHSFEKPAVGGNPPPPESSGAVEVALEALGVDDASVVPRPVPLAAWEGASVRSRRPPTEAAARPQMRWGARGETGSGPARNNLRYHNERCQAQAR